MYKLKLLFKYLIFKIFYFLKLLINLKALNKLEKKGKLIDFRTNLKLLRGSRVILPYEIGRSIRGLSHKNLKKDPLGKFFVRLVNHKSTQKELLKYLLKIYKSEQVKNAGQFLGFKNNLILSNYPSWAIVMPWDKETLQERYIKYKKKFDSNRLNYFSKNINKNNLHFYSKLNALSQIYQTKKLIKSFKKFGVRDSMDLPIVNILVNDNEWRWLMSDQGNHRYYILYLLKHKNFSCVISQKILRKDFLKWPNVVNGVFSPEESLYIFDSCFYGNKCIRGNV